MHPLDIWQTRNGEQYAFRGRIALYFRPNRRARWVCTTAPADQQYLDPVGSSDITNVDAAAPVFTGSNLAELSAWYKGAHA